MTAEYLRELDTEIDGLRTEVERLREQCAWEADARAKLTAAIEQLKAYAQHERSLGAEGPMIELVSARQEIERLTALLRRHHLRGAYWDNELAVETRAALQGAH